MQGGADAAPGKGRGDGPRPLQLIRLNMGSNDDTEKSARSPEKVEIIQESLQIIGQNLRKTGADSVSIVSIMGKYRSGKSFMLDLIMRYLKHMGGKTSSCHTPAPASETSAADEGAGTPEGLSEVDENWCMGQSAPTPAWFEEGGGKMGFKWQAGEAKCTEGIWVWSEPIVFPSLKKGARPTAVLIMDTQGAWDSTMTKSQSATIFGLTALLSSKLIYNMKGEVSEAEIDNLDYFVTFAQSACANLPGTNQPLGTLQFLVRDWEHYDDEEDGLTYAKCKEMMDGHIDAHTNPDKAPDPKRKLTLERLRDSFRGIQCFGLPHPGQQVTKKDFTGQIEKINTDFVQLADRFIHGLLKDDFPTPSAPLGFELSVRSFETVITNFTQAFRDNKVDAVTLRDGYVRCACTQHREDVMAKFKQAFARDAPDARILDPDELELTANKNVTESMEEFRVELNKLGMDPTDKASEEKSLLEAMNSIVSNRKTYNNAQVEGAQMKIVASPVVGCASYFLFYHTCILTVLCIAVGWMATKAEMVRQNSSNACEPKVLNSVGQKAVAWIKQRWVDLQAMRIAASRCDPNKVIHIVMATTGKVATATNAAVAAAQQQQGTST